MNHRNGTPHAKPNHTIGANHGVRVALATAGLLLSAAMTLTAQQFSPQDAIGIMTQGDGNGPCDPEHGADNAFYGAGCCGSPGLRECGIILHPGKGPLSNSPGCTNPDANIIRWSSYDGNLFCQLPSTPPEATNLLPAAKDPNSPRDFQFFVTSDLHFYRIWFDVNDMVNHVARINAVQLAAALSGHPYTAVIVPGDITTGGSEERLGAYRLLWERNTLPGASISLPVYFGLGNHDASAKPNGFGTDSTGGQRMWEYLDSRFSGLHLDISPTGCLAFIDPGCVGLGPLAGSHNYSWDWEGVHMVMLNTWAGDTDRAYPPPLGMNGLNWLTRDLDYYVGSSGRPVIMFQHYRLADEGGPEWSSADVSDFQQVIQKYNVVGLFSGHSHDLSFSSKGAAVNQTGLSSSGPGTTLDNFVDGAGGDCYHHGDPPLQYLCGNATSNFLTVHISDHYMDVTANSWKNNQPTWVDNTINLRGPTGAASGTCRKRLDPTYIDVTSQVKISVNNNIRTITVANPSSAALTGQLAVQVGDSYTVGLSAWDFVDSCDPKSGNPYLLIGGTILPGNSFTSVSFTGTGDLRPERMKVFRLSDSLSVDNNAPTVGSTPVTVNLSSLSGNPVSFTYRVDPYLDGQTTQWLHVTANQTTTPAAFTLTADNLPSYAHYFASFTIMPADANIAPITVKVTLAPATLNVTTNVSGAQMNLYASKVGVPYNIVVSPGNAELLNVPSPQYPSASIRYVFRSWGDGQPQQHYVTVPIGGLNLALTFDAAYQVTPTIVPAGSGHVDLTRTSSGGYYPAGNIGFKAVPNDGYYFVGYSGGLKGTDIDVTADLEFPLSFNATFAADASITLSSNLAASEGSKLSLNNVASSAPVTAQFPPGTALTFSAPGSFTSLTNPGIRYIFMQWSDGVTSPLRTVPMGTANLNYIAQYKTQYLVTATASPAGAGTVLGGGWYDSGTQVAVQASPAAGFKLSGISGDLTSSLSPLTFAAGQPVRLVANFAPSGVPKIYAANGGAGHDVVTPFSGTTRLVPFSLTDSASSGALGVQIDSITNIQVLIGSGTVTSQMSGPMVAGDLLSGASTTVAVPFDWPATATRVRLTVNFSANGGTYKSSTILNLFR